MLINVIQSVRTLGLCHISRSEYIGYCYPTSRQFRICPCSGLDTGLGPKETKQWVWMVSRLRAHAFREQGPVARGWALASFLGLRPPGFLFPPAAHPSGEAEAEFICRQSPVPQFSHWKGTPDMIGSEESGQVPWSSLNLPWPMGKFPY